MELLASKRFPGVIMDENGGAHPFDTVVAEEGGLHFVKEDLIPQKSSLYQKEGYFLVLEEKEELPDLYISRITLEMTREKILPEKLLVNGISAPIGSVHPFGKPLQLYQEFVIVSGEAFTKKGARITLDFELDYDIYEENLEIPETDLEYKVIMKKPKKALEIQAAQVFADYVVWEYLSRTGWKQIWREEHIAVMFHGNQEGHMTLSFLCPEDMEDDPELIRQGTVRARLMRAENIYKVPAVYKCPRITGLNLSYAYEKERLPADYAMIKNSFEEQDVTKELASGTAVKVFITVRTRDGCMYLGFRSR